MHSSNSVRNKPKSFVLLIYSDTVSQDTFIQKTKKLYLDTKSERNLDKVAKELSDVHRIMTKSIQDVLARGSKIDSTYCPTSSNC